jgi:hypothetical protein
MGSSTRLAPAGQWHGDPRSGSKNPGRLLPQPGGFEGLVAVAVEHDLHDLSLA